jgi:Na+(H+)/acetate symporter ActP
MFNAVCKIPMQFFILLLGALVFVFYQFEQPPVFFNEVAWKSQADQAAGARLRALAADFAAVHAEKQQSIHVWLDARHAGDPQAASAARAAAIAAQARSEAIRTETKKVLHAADPRTSTNDSDYVFITFVLAQLPHGVIGLLVAAIFAAALSSKASELNALGATTTIDFYRHVVRREASDAHYVTASKWFTAFWGLVALAFALFAHLVENLIQAVNILGSVFYGVVLGLFLVAFFLRRVGGTAVFWAALSAQVLVFGLYFTLNISYLWYNFIGCAACVLFSLILQVVLRSREAAGSVSAST